MPRPKKTEVEIQAMRTKILDVALAILLDEGPEAISSRAIAKRLDMAHMSLFTYFKNQAAILSALAEREMARWRAPQDAIVQRAQSEEISVLVQELLEFYVTFAREKPGLHRLAWVMPEAVPAIAEDSRQQILASVNQLARLLKLGMERGDFKTRDPFLAASTALGIVNMPFILSHGGKLTDPALRDRMVDEVLAATMGYLKKE